MMMYRVSAFCSSSEILNIRKRDVSETASVSILMLGEGDTCIVKPSPEDEKIQFPKRCVF
jgi:hypothetical protein